tara:strand:+ start:138 stop:1973 length:1836 start_codon:yes stop_codon:yes gene_type:complete
MATGFEFPPGNRLFEVDGMLGGVLGSVWNAPGKIAEGVGKVFDGTAAPGQLDGDIGVPGQGGIFPSMGAGPRPRSSVTPQSVIDESIGDTVRAWGEAIKNGLASFEDVPEGIKSNVSHYITYTSEPDGSLLEDNVDLTGDNIGNDLTIDSYISSLQGTQSAVLEKALKTPSSSNNLEKVLHGELQNKRLSGGGIGVELDPVDGTSLLLKLPLGLPSISPPLKIKLFEPDGSIRPLPDIIGEATASVQNAVSDILAIPGKLIDEAKKTLDDLAKEGLDEDSILERVGTIFDGVLEGTSGELIDSDTWITGTILDEMINVLNSSIDDWKEGSPDSGYNNPFPVSEDLSSSGDASAAQPSPESSDQPSPSPSDLITDTVNPDNPDPAPRDYGVDSVGNPLTENDFNIIQNSDDFGRDITSDGIVTSEEWRNWSDQLEVNQVKIPDDASKKDSSGVDSSSFPPDSDDPSQDDSSKDDPSKDDSDGPLTETIDQSPDNKDPDIIINQDPVIPPGLPPDGSGSSPFSDAPPDDRRDVDQPEDQPENLFTDPPQEDSPEEDSGGGGGGGGGSGGMFEPYSGSINYALPQFQAVPYNLNKDYNVSLDRIMKESLFGNFN